MRNFFTKTGCALWMAVLFSFNAYGQVEIEWDRTYGGDHWDELVGVAEAPDGGYLLGGISSSSVSGDKTEGPVDISYGPKDIWIVKTDAAGQKEWDKVFSGDGYDYLQVVLATADGGFLLGASSDSNASGDKSEDSRGDYDMWIIKTDAQGNKEWDRTIGGNGSDELHEMIPTPDGGYLLGGSSNSNASGDKSEDAKDQAGVSSDIWIVKIDASGNKEWDKTFGSTNYDVVRSIVLLSDGGYLLGGNQRHELCEGMDAGNYWDMWLIRIDAAGNALWDRKYGSCGNDFLLDVALAEDGGFLLGGNSSSDASGDKSEEQIGYDDYWVLKVDASGNKLWDKTFGGTGMESFKSILPMPDGGFLLGGLSYSPVSGNKTAEPKGYPLSDYWLVRIDNSGTKLWDQAVGGSNYDYLQTMIATADGNYLLAGHSRSDISGDKTEDSRGWYDYWIVKIKEEREVTPPPVTDRPTIEWDKAYGGLGFNELTTALALPDGRILLAGSSSAPISGNKTAPVKGSLDYWLVMTDAAGNKLWDRSFGGNDADHLTSVVPAPDGGFLLGGYSRSEVSGDKSEGVRGERDFDTDMWVVKIDASGNKLWDRTYGGNLDDYLDSAVPTADGGFLLAGASASAISYEKTAAPRGSYDYWLVKIDAVGNKLWDRAYGGSDRDLWTSIIPVGDNFLLGGTSSSNVSGDKSEPSRGEADFWLVMVDEAGNKLWDRTYGGNKIDQFRAMLALEDGGFLLGGISTSDASGEKSEDAKSNVDGWVLRIDAAGNKVWDRTYGNGRVHDLEAAPDGGFLIGGDFFASTTGDRTAPHYGKTDYSLIKVDTDGNRQWDENYGGDDNDYLSALVQVEGGLLLAGQSYSDASGNKTAENIAADYWVVKVRLGEEREPEMPAPTPTTGFISGSGWIFSPVGAYVPDHFVQGRALFNFLVRQLEEKEPIRGHVSFWLPDARIHFMSEEIEWISVDEDRAFVKGTGKLNREEGYHFLISVQDRGRGASAPNDKLRIMIWEPQQTIIYDNQMGDPMYAGAEMEIQRGLIQIHELKRTTPSAFARASESPADPMPIAGFRVYPTVLNDVGLWLEFPEVSDRQELTLRIFDIQGRQMTSLPLSIEKGSSRQFWQTNHQHWPKGIYFLRLSNGREEYRQRLLK